MDLIAFLHRKRDFSLATFGPGQRTAGVLDHMRKEIAEVEAAPTDLGEWMDLVMLAFDGAWRAGYTPEQIADALVATQDKLEGRKWPDWRTVDRDKGIQHIPTT